MLQLQLGNYEEALAHLERMFELGERDPGLLSDLHCLQYFNGELSTEQIVAHMRASRDVVTAATYAFALADHPDPARRDALAALEEFERRSEEFASTNWAYGIEAVIRVRLEDWQGAEAALQSRFTPSDVFFLTPNALNFLRALVHAELGESKAARENYLRGMAVWERHTGGDPAAWETSDVMRWRRAAEAAMQ